MCTIKKAIYNVEVKVDAQKGAVGFRGKTNIRCVNFIQLMVSSIGVIW